MKLLGAILDEKDIVNKEYVDTAIENSRGIFIAVYTRTTYAELTAAIAANKVILLDMTANNNLFCMTYSTYTNGGNAILYAIFDYAGRPSLITATLTPSDHWTISNRYLQDELVSGTNIKTINNQSLLGSGNITIEAGTVDQTYTPTSINAQSGTAVAEAVGDLSALTTSDKTSLVPAINEVNAKIGVSFEVGAEKWYGTYKDGNTIYPVYSKVIYIPALPSTPGITPYPHGITGIKQILCVYGSLSNSMVMNAPRQNNQDNICIYQVQKGGNIQIEVGKDRSSISAYVTLIYAKNN